MKKVLSIVAIAAFAATFTACKKDYTCECSGDWDQDGTISADEKQTYQLEDVKKKDAKDACNSVGNLWILGGGTCELK